MIQASSVSNGLRITYDLHQDGQLREYSRNEAV
jgi:hypothetical protein